jgi:hypothetical protein
MSPFLILEVHNGVRSLNQLAVLPQLFTRNEISCCLFKVSQDPKVSTDLCIEQGDIATTNIWERNPRRASVLTKNCRVVLERKQEWHEKQDNLTFERATGAS